MAVPYSIRVHIATSLPPHCHHIATPEQPQSSLTLPDDKGTQLLPIDGNSGAFFQKLSISPRIENSSLDIDLS